jgi:phospholipase/carboxylesterase
MLQTELVPAQNGNSRNLLIALHGLGDSMEGNRWVPQMIGNPNLNVLLVNAPDAYYGGFSWYDYAAGPDVVGVGVERSYRLVESLLDSTSAKGFAPERTILFGFSQGCLMSVEAAVRYPKLLAGVIGISGYIHDVQRLLKVASPVARQQRFLITHGTDDPLISLSVAESDFGALKAAGFQIDFRILPKVHTIIEPELEMFHAFINERLPAANS